MSATVRVRIGVAVDNEGDWSSIGWHRMKEGDIFDAAEGCSGNAVRFFWLEADLPRPVVETRTAQEVIEVQDPSQTKAE